jgi:hypothetical protein
MATHQKTDENRDWYEYFTLLTARLDRSKDVLAMIDCWCNAVHFHIPPDIRTWITGNPRDRNLWGAFLLAGEMLSSVCEREGIDGSPIRRLERTIITCDRDFVKKPQVTLGLLSAKEIKRMQPTRRQLYDAFVSARGCIKRLESKLKLAVPETRRWIGPMSKVEMASRLLIGRRAFDSFTKLHPLKKVGRQQWMICVDRMDLNTRSRVETGRPPK